MNLYKVYQDLLRVRTNRTNLPNCLSQQSGSGTGVSKPGLLPPNRIYGRALRKVTITGLPGDAWGMEPLIVRLLSLRVSSTAKIGIGKGYPGSMCHLEPTAPCVALTVTGRPEIEWIHAEEVEEWIYQHGYLSPLRINEWTEKLRSNFDRNGPFFRRWI